MLEVAQKYYSLGLSVIPVNADKQPFKVKEFTTHRIEPNGNFNEAFGIAIVCGALSGNVECIDIDTKYDLTGTLYSDYKRAIYTENPELLKKLVVEQSPSGGYHFIYKCKKVEGNTKLARRPTTEQEKSEKPGAKVNVLIETRGEGGYFMCAPSKGYKLTYGDFDHIQEITEEERETLFTTARQFNSFFTEAVVRYPNTSRVYKSKSPIDDFNERGDTIQLLVNEGWTVVEEKANKTHLLRPGGTQRLSASYLHDCKQFYVFSSSTEFEQEKLYSPAAVYCLLKCKNDWHECVKQLAADGYGEKVERIDEVKITKEDNDYRFVIDKEEIEQYIDDSVHNRKIMGVDWGIPLLDEHFKFKYGSFNVINGHQNVGKSTFLWYLAAVSAQKIGLKWIIYSPENKAGYISRKIMEFYVGKVLSRMTSHERRTALDLMYQNFVIIGDKEYFSYQDIIKAAEKTLAIQHFDAILIDPYNALKIEVTEYRALGGHEYHYQAASLFRIFCKRYNISLYLNTHSVTGAQRSKDKDGKLVAPHMSDIEGGGKWGNKADDFLTIHRNVGDGTTGSLTQVLVRKIKEVETGGSVTLQGEPLLFEFKDHCRFIAPDGTDAIDLLKNPRNKSSPNYRDYYNPNDNEDSTPF